MTRRSTGVVTIGRCTTGDIGASHNDSFDTAVEFENGRGEGHYLNSLTDLTGRVLEVLKGYRPDEAIKAGRRGMS